MDARLETRLEILKRLLGIPDGEKDGILEFALNDAEETVKNYCNLEEIPMGLEHTVLRMAMDIYRNEQFGDDSVPVTVKSISEGDTSTSFGTVESSGYAQTLLKNYQKQLNRYRKVVF